MYSNDVLNMARKIYDYMNIRDAKIEKSDLIAGFGHFDIKIPQHCASLYQKNLSRKILFTGGRGAGSADMKEAEAVEFKNELLRVLPAFPEKDLILESESTNTGENITFSEKILKGLDPGFTFGQGIGAVIAVASPYRQKRVHLALKKLFPRVKVYNSPPESAFEDEMKLFCDKGEDLVKHLIGELERIKVYPEKGFIEYEEIPDEIGDIYRELRALTDR